MSEQISEIYDEVLREGGFIWGPFPSAYGGVSGMHMLAPMGAQLFNEICAFLRGYYRQLGFSEVYAPSLGIYDVWKASGHVDGFTDPLIVCSTCHIRYRGDKLLAEHFPEILTDDVPFEELGSMLQEVDLKCPECGTHLTDIRPYSVMFETTIGTDRRAFLRPETATTTYLAFTDYVRYLAPPWPIKVFQIGQAFRNEINPRRTLVRWREFHQAEFQVIAPPLAEFTHSSVDIDSVGDVDIPITTVDDQSKGIETPTVYTPDQLIKRGMVDKPMLAWCLATACKAIREMGFQDFRLRQHLYPRMRFRHPPTGPAVHNIFAWDVEHKVAKYDIWVEMAGVHDRADYDCRMHDAFSQESFKYKTSDGQEHFPLIYEMAFGVERILVCIIDNALRVDSDRVWLDLGARFAPVKCSLLPFTEKRSTVQAAQNIYDLLWNLGVSCNLMTRKTLGARFHEADLMGIPYCISMDESGLENNMVRLREIWSRRQKDIILEEAPQLVRALVKEQITFDDVSGEVVA
jgi:glycyl-tRNA synthetase